MKFCTVVGLVTALVGGAVAQDTTLPAVPTGTPIPGDYNGAYRPQHFMNDPNGMFLDANGTYHLYYQYNPTANVAGNQHWGHATSRDLYHWINQPIAIFPPTNDSQVFSGSAVVDVNNTSGFFPDQNNGVVAIYTLNTPTAQVQEISYSHDGGYTFAAFAENPVINSTSTQFRDPKVIWFEDHWVMVISYSQEFAVGIYTSPDLKTWSHASNFTHHGLLASTRADGAARVADFAKDNYAGQFFYGVPDGQDAVSIAWASNWQYTQVVPTAQEGWRSAMSLPRRNFLANVTRIGWDLISLPYDLSPVLGEQLASSTSLVNSSLVVDYSGVASNAVYFEANVTGVSGSSSAATLNFTILSPVSGESIRGGYYFGGDNPFFVDRGRVRGFDDPFFTDKFSTSTVLRADGTWTLSGVVDRSLLEVFVDGGVASATASFFATQPLTLLTLSTAQLPANASVSVAVYALQSAWKEYENGEGNVLGNVTTTAEVKRDEL
ncbi:Extracellular exo-inulinase inuE [Trametes pubescens]|uniref:Extracellular exo-inulinase inuE n=1 Tax=Trametes pubescens TaxID=154538 RepID=A0A1M2VLT6_TRAPU|nr:Extracellular exo-inulinase inuE [Trametes pubescens]